MDIDEILIPLDGHKNFLDFLRNQDRAYTNSFVFRNVFMLSPEKSTNNSLLYTQFYSKKSQVFPYNQRSKMVAKGKKLISISQHWPELVSPETIRKEIDPSVGLLYHYRDGIDSEVPVDDSSATEYFDELKGRVSLVCREIFTDGNCTRS
jgi:hypothetical protein